ncbi:TadE/TadG family type IV pilus assembly protein [Nocardiopsis sp. NPDC050513]|uniref:TadE/TadG family type IV pilus assembly protein n=1 Tax=Nocardiopsis sp. NPDC050513 TaxID=3364338 RepID=UPI0037961214
MTPWRGRGQEGDRGSASVEVILIVPVLLAFLALLTLTGRSYTAGLAADALAHGAARSASLYLDPGEARAAAERAVAESVGTWGRACQNPSVTIQHTTTAGDRAVQADVTCVSQRDDLPGLGLGERRTISGHATSVLDVHREREP